MTAKIIYFLVSKALIITKINYKIIFKKTSVKCCIVLPFITQCCPLITYMTMYLQIIKSNCLAFMNVFPPVPDHTVCVNIRLHYSLHNERPRSTSSFSFKFVFFPNTVNNITITNVFVWHFDSVFLVVLCSNVCVEWNRKFFWTSFEPALFTSSEVVYREDNPPGKSNLWMFTGTQRTNHVSKNIFLCVKDVIQVKKLSEFNFSNCMKN